MQRKWAESDALQSLVSCSPVAVTLSSASSLWLLGWLPVPTILWLLISYRIILKFLDALLWAFVISSASTFTRLYLFPMLPHSPKTALLTAGTALETRGMKSVVKFPMAWRQYSLLGKLPLSPPLKISPCLPPQVVLPPSPHGTCVVTWV